MDGARHGTLSELTARIAKMGEPGSQPEIGWLRSYVPGIADDLEMKAPPGNLAAQEPWENANLRTEQ